MITEADLRTCTMREVAHYNGGPAWFGYGYQCNEHPRLGRITRYYRKTKATESTFSVDGKDVKDLAEAAERLNVPAVMTGEEQEICRSR